MVHHRAQLRDLALGRRGQLVRLTLGGGLDALRLALGRSPQVVGLTLGVGPQLGSLVLGAGPQLGGINLRRGQQLACLCPGLLQDLVALLLGQPQQLLNPGAEARVRRALLLLHLPVEVSDLLLGRLVGLPHVAQPGVHLVEVSLDLILVIATHFLREDGMRLVLVKESTELSIDIGLHVA